MLLAANSTDNQQDQPMVESKALQRGISGNTQFSPASVEHLKQIARNIDTEGQPLQIDATETNERFLFGFTPWKPQGRIGKQRLSF